MRGNTAVEFVVDRAVHAETLGTRRIAQPRGKLDLDVVLVLDVFFRASRLAGEISLESSPSRSFHAVIPWRPDRRPDRVSVVSASPQRRRPVTRLIRRPKKQGGNPYTCIFERAIAL